LDPKIADVAKQFVLLRIENMRGVNLELFEFDYDLTWAAFFLNSDERVLGRFGGRLPDDIDKYKSLDGLRVALAAALARHTQAPPTGKKVERAVRTIEEYPSAAKVSPKSCFHCHNVYDHRREWMQSNQKWALDEVWVYPLPENLGWTLAVERGNQVEKVAGLAEAAGIKPGDALLEVNGLSVASFADVQYALHKAPAVGEISVKWLRDEKVLQASLKPGKDWKHTDVSWRRSLEGLQPASGLHGEDLTAEEKKAIGLGPKALAFRQGNFLTKQARQAGIQQNDIIVGLGGKKLEMTARQFDAHVRLHFVTGETIVVDVLRQGKRLELMMKLSGTA
jgi:serine protease Do